MPPDPSGLKEIAALQIAKLNEHIDAHLRFIHREPMTLGDGNYTAQCPPIRSVRPTASEARSRAQNPLIPSHSSTSLDASCQPRRAAQILSTCGNAPLARATGALKARARSASHRFSQSLARPKQA